MSDLQQHFSAAQASIKTLTERPENAVMLKLYTLYKQATQGDATGERPGMTDYVARAKYDAWAALKGMSNEAAMQQYIELVNAQIGAA